MAYNKNKKIVLFIASFMVVAFAAAFSFIKVKKEAYVGKSAGNAEGKNQIAGSTDVCPVEEEDNEEYLFLGCNGFF